MVFGCFWRVLLDLDAIRRVLRFFQSFGMISGVFIIFEPFWHVFVVFVVFSAV